MNPYDLAHQLAKALTASDEYRAFKGAQQLLEADEEAKKMLMDLRKKQMEVETLKLQGKSKNEDEKALENLYNIVSYNSLLKSYLETEHRFAQMVMDIQNILAKALDPES